MSRPATVELHVRDGRTDEDVAVVLRSDDVTVAEVFDALGVETATAIDGWHIAQPQSVRALDVLQSGSVLFTDVVVESGGAQRHREFLGGLRISVVAGLDAGASIDLTPGLHRVSVGTCSHESLLLRVDDASGSATAVPWHEQLAAIEAVWADDNVLAVGPSIRPEVGVGLVLHRPPRAMAGDGVEPLVKEPVPDEVPDPAPLSWATLLAPIPVALMMALFFRPIFALFAAMGPLMALGRWAEARRRYRIDTKARQKMVDEQERRWLHACAVQAEAAAELRWLVHPHVAELWCRARCGSVRLWERRPEHGDYLQVGIGVGPALVPLVTDDRATSIRSDDEPLQLRPVPHMVDLRCNVGVGVFGERSDALAVVRSLVAQAATLHGPSDLAVGFLGLAERLDDWDWLKWLPHLDQSLVAHDATKLASRIGSQEPRSVSGLGGSWSQTSDVGAVSLLVVDDPTADIAALQRSADASQVHVRYLVVAPSPTALPAVCSAIVHVLGPTATIATPQAAGLRAMVCPTGISETTAKSWARSLSRMVDPEQDRLDASGGRRATLFEVLSFSTATDLVRRWNDCQPGAGAVVPLGIGPEGVFSVNLTEDGPHALVAGTTGSGKSELLRTLVAGLAAQSPPDHLNFVLVDFKGGGAFDVVNELPHVAGLITDLDPTLVERAITSLRAELHRRETLFRDLQVSDFEDAARRAEEPIARLVVVIDEFAALASDYGELLTAIVDLAARGRSLGMHLVLATQRPSGVVDQKIRANTNLRIALRVQDALDSHDVVGIGDAVSIDRKMPGRAIVSIGGDKAFDLQTAFSGCVDRRDERCAVRPLTLTNSEADGDRETLTSGGSTELEVLVAAIGEASAARSRARSLWLDPLPASLDWIDLATRDIAPGPPRTGEVTVGLEDVPERQTQEPWRWDPAAGPLAIFGASGSCAAKAMVSIGAGLCCDQREHPSHLYVVDGSGGLLELAQRGSTGAYITIGETDRIERAVAFLESEIAKRRAGSPGDARLVLLIENLAAVLDSFDDAQAANLTDRFSSIARDGSSLGVHVVVSARTVRDISHRLAQQFGSRLILALADMTSYLALGLRAREVPVLPEMRAIDLATRRLVQLVEPPAAGTLGQSDSSGVAPTLIGTLPDSVLIDDLPLPVLADGELHLPIGIDADDLHVAVLSLSIGTPGLVVARNGLGRSTTLRLIADQIERAPIDVQVVWIMHGSSTSTGSANRHTAVKTVADLESVLGAAVGPSIVLVDDAHHLPPEFSDVLQALIAAREGRVSVIVGTTPEHARSIRSWVATIRAEGTGVLLPGSVTDADVFGARAPALAGVGQVPGRGFVVTRGRPQAAQIGCPAASD